MCGRFVVDERVGSYINKINGKPIVRLPENIPTGEIFPSGNALILKQSADELSANIAQWGYQSPVNKGLIINARVETAAVKPTFTESFRIGRILVPASGFFEWDSAKKKHLIKGESELIFLAGLSRTEGDKERFVILTTSSAGQAAKIHDRMPVIVSEKEMQRYFSEASFVSVLAKRTPTLFINEV